MARAAAKQIENSFIKGLITEATGLNYPENSCVETWDCEFDFFGRVSRRLAMDFETESTPATIDKTNSAINQYLWRNASGDGLTQLVVVQIGSNLHFYNGSNFNLSASKSATIIDLTTFSPSGAPAAALYDCQFADGLGKLYVFHPYLENFYVTYDPNAQTCAATAYLVAVRDFEGAIADPHGDTGAPTETFATLIASDKDHAYNLYNQGWPTNNTYLMAWDAAGSDMPSNADVWWAYKNADGAFDMTVAPNVARANTLAPKGSLIFNVYKIDRSSILSGVANTTSGTARTSTGVFYLGRVWYTGINASGYSNKILFSQIIERPEQAGRCYQVQDPTSEDLFDLLPADGGVISLPEAGQIFKLFPFGSGLLIFAQRGVWYITGNQGLGFTATDFSVNRLSSIRSNSASSFVDVNGSPMWWNIDGIWTVQNTNAGPQVKSMSIDTIQTFYDDIPNLGKLNAKGYFNLSEQVVQWLFRSAEAGSVEDNYSFDTILNFNVVTGAFYPWTISPGVEVHGLVVVDGVAGNIQENLIVNDAAVQIVDNLGDNIVAFNFTAATVVPTTKFLVSYVSGSRVFTWAEHNSETYTDWPSVVANEIYTSYFITGYKLHGQGISKFAPMYLTVYHQGNGQAYIQGIWDYAVDTSTGRFSTKQYLVFADDRYSNLSKRVKIRGQGKTLQYKVTSVAAEPFTISGWAAYETGNTMP